MTETSINWIEYFHIIRRRKWFIIIPTFLCMAAAAIYGFAKTPAYRVESIISPSRFFVLSSATSRYSEILPVSPTQIVAQLQYGVYDTRIKEELNIRKLPTIKAEELDEANYVRIYVDYADISKGKQILNLLLTLLKEDLNRRIEAEILEIENQISKYKYDIKTDEHEIENLKQDINNNLNEMDKNKVLIAREEILKNQFQEEIVAAQNNLAISQERIASILEELKEVKERIDNLEVQQRIVLERNPGATESISLLLYSNEVQNNLRYVSTLDDKLTMERVNQESLGLTIRKNEEEKKLNDNNIDTLRKSIKEFEIQNRMKENDIRAKQDEIGEATEQISFLSARKGRIDYAQFIKEPEARPGHVYPKRKLYVSIAGILSLAIFVFLAFFLESLKGREESA